MRLSSRVHCALLHTHSLAPQSHFHSLKYPAAPRSHNRKPVGRVGMRTPVSLARDAPGLRAGYVGERAPRINFPLRRRRIPPTQPPTHLPALAACLRARHAQSCQTPAACCNNRTDSPRGGDVILSSWRLKTTSTAVAEQLDVAGGLRRRRQQRLVPQLG